MKNKDYTYFQSLFKDKEKSVNHIIENTLQKTQSMFYYSGLPLTIPQNDLELILQKYGTAFVTEINGNLYALYGGLGGMPDVYGHPTQITVANVALNLSKTFDVNKDGVLIKNDNFGKGLIDIIGKYAVLLTDSTISLNTAAVLSRLTMLISASDDKTKQSADLFIEKILNGEFSVIAENAFLKGVNLQQITNANHFSITNLIELTQYYKANLLNAVGLNANFNMKRERLNETEIMLNNDDLLPFVENMLFERKNAIQKINEKYGTQINVELKSVWKTEKENNDKTNETLNTETEEENNLTVENVSRENDNENIENVSRENDNENIENVSRENDNENIENVSRENDNENVENVSRENDNENVSHTQKVINIIREIRNEMLNEEKENE